MSAAIVKARTLDRNEALKKVVKTKEENERVRFITIYDPRLPDIGKILVMLDSDGRLKGAFPKAPMVCFRRPPNIKDILCRAKLPPRKSNMRVKKPGMRRCSKPSCKSPIDCQDKNLIYELHCLKDSLPYLGETSKTAEARFVVHINTILQDCHTNIKTPVGQHFRLPGHSHTAIQVTPFEKIKSRNPFVRKAREAHLIDKHQLINNGLNKIL